MKFIVVALLLACIAGSAEARRRKRRCKQKIKELCFWHADEHTKMGCVKFKDGFHWGKACQDHKFEVAMEVVIEDCKKYGQHVNHVLIDTCTPHDGCDGQWERYAPYTSFGDFVRSGKRYFHGEYLTKGPWSIEATIGWDKSTRKAMSFKSIGICPKKYKRRLGSVVEEPTSEDDIFNIDMRQYSEDGTLMPYE